MWSFLLKVRSVHLEQKGLKLLLQKSMLLQPSHSFVINNCHQKQRKIDCILYVGLRIQ